MYYQYFGLNEAPFSIAVNPRYLFMSDRHRDALAHLLYGVGSGGSFILLTGEVGTGKTTINRCLLEQLPDSADIAIILNPALNAQELLASACDELGIDYDSDTHTLKTLTDKLHQFLLANHGRGRSTVLMIDEAQHLDFAVLEQIRLLTNLETNSQKLLQIILIGQPELARLLQRPELRQLNQRITARYNLEPLDLPETGAYIRHRLQVAGLAAGRELFPPAVVRGIFRRSRGIPRLINLLCDRMLLGAYGRNKSQLDHSMLELASREVMGSESLSRARPRWWLPVASAVAIALAAIVFWWPLRPTPALAPRTTSAVDALPPAISVAGTQNSEGAAAAPVLLAPEAIPSSSSSSSSGSGSGSTPNWLLPPALALADFWRLHSTVPVPAAPCSKNLPDGLACVTARERSWEDLAKYDRPLLLDTLNSERFGAAIVLLGVDDTSARVLTGDGDMVAVSRSQFDRYERGDLRFLWRPPPGFQRPLALGDTGPVVSHIAGLFASLDEQPEALAGSEFNDALARRVRLFQRDHDLVDDGVVGMRTLLRLNEQLGIDVTLAGATRRLQTGFTTSNAQ